MKIIALSDLHGYLPLIEDECDVVCICGDITPLEIDGRNYFLDCIGWFYMTFIPWCMNLPCDKVIFTAGNHDRFLEQVSIDINGNLRSSFRTGVKMQLPDKIIFLIDNTYTFNNVRFYATPWCPNLYKWAFYGGNSEELSKKFSKIPNNIDVLISHAAPSVELYGTTTEMGRNYMIDFGSVELTREIEKKKPKLSIFGHIHSGTHIPKEINGTTFCNVSIMSENYNYSYEPKYFII